MFVTKQANDNEIRKTSKAELEEIHIWHLDHTPTQGEYLNFHDAGSFIKLISVIY
jgi:hypothetical protein